MKNLLPGWGAFRAAIVSFCLLCAQNISSQNVTVSGAVSGNGSYPTLQSAFIAINSSAQSAASITVDISASTTETASALLNNGGWSFMLIRAVSGAQTVSGNVSAPLVDFNGVTNVSVDGSSLTVSNSNTGNALTATIRFINGASNNTITNCTIEGASTSSTLGTVTFSTSTGSGNSNNRIIGCRIGPVGSNMAVNGIYSAGTSTAANSGNIIINNFVFDFFNAGEPTSGIAVASNSTGWTISGCRIYQTASRTYTTSNTHRGIWIGSGDGYSVTDNVIGYSSASQTGTMVLGGSVANRYVAIEISAGTTLSNSIQGNTITAISFSTSSSAATVNGILCGVNLISGSALILNNLVGSTSGVGAIACYPTTSGGAFVGINSSSTGTVTITGNYVGSAFSSGTTAGVSGGVLGINISGISTNLSITSNTIGNPAANNLRGGTSGLTTGNSLFYGIFLTSTPTGTVIITNNLIRNGASFGSGTGGVLRGIYTTGLSGSTTFSVVLNTVSDLTTNNANVAVGNGQLGNVGIAITCGSQNRIARNTIFNIANTTTATTAVNVGGISTAVSTDPVIESNVIYNISNTGLGTSVTAPPMVFGIFIRGSGGNCNVQNNMISLGGNSSDNTAIAGIVAFGGGGAPTLTKIYYNTINISGVVGTGGHPSLGILRGNFSGSVTFPVDIRNNLITNSRTGGTGAHVAIGNAINGTPSSTGWGVNAANFNILNAPTATVAWWGGAQTLASWQSTCNCDAASRSGVPVTYVNAVSDLHLNMGLTPTYIESYGQAVTGLSVDIDSQSRPGPVGSVNGGAVAPDIGADEIDGVPVTCTTAAGGSLSATTGSACSGQTLAVSSASATSGFGIVYQWQVGTSAGGPYSNVSGGSGANTISYTSAPLSTGIHYVVLRTTCNGSITAISNEATLTVLQTPSSSVTIASPTLCAGGSFSLVGSTNIGTTFNWSGPNGFSSTSQTAALSNAGTAASGEYSMVTVANTCSSSAAIQNVLVKPLPLTMTITPTPTAICAGDNATITMQGGNLSSILNFTPQTNQNAATGYPAPYTVYYGGQRMQILIRATELLAAGIQAGSLTAIQFPVVSLGANWGSSLMDLQGFQVSVGHTTQSALSGTFQGGLTLVSGPSNFTPVVGYNNVHTFSTPFIWNGTSNIIVETMFTNNITGVTADGVVQYNSPTSFQSTIVYRADSQPLSTFTGATGSNTAVNFARPDFKLHGTSDVPFSWSPSTGLSSTVTATVQASPPVTTIYTVTADNGGCIRTGTAVMNVTPIPTVSVLSSTSTVCAGGSITLTALGANNPTWSTSQTTTEIVVNPTVTTGYTIVTKDNPCPLASAEVTITVNPLPNVAIAPASVSACVGSAAGFTASGATSYTWNTTGIGSSTSIPVVSNTVIAAAGTDANGCVNSATANLTANPLPTVSIVQSASIVCPGAPVTLSATGASSFAWNGGAQTANISVNPTLTTAYTVTGTLPTGCSSNTTANVLVHAAPVISVSPGSATVCEGNEIGLSVTGGVTYTWMPGNQSGNSVTVTPAGPSVVYSVTAKDVNDCEAMASTVIQVDPCAALDEISFGRSILLFPNPTAGEISLSFSFEGEKQISVHSVTGILVIRTNTSDMLKKIDLSGHAKGLYLVTVASQGKSQQFRVVLD
jgi:hypothetical protein